LTHLLTLVGIVTFAAAVHLQDLAAALCAFSSMRRLMKGDFLAEFLAEVAEKLPTFGLPALASVLGALGRLGYRPGDAWTEKVRGHCFLKTKNMIGVCCCLICEGREFVLWYYLRLCCRGCCLEY
jgi:hypothetical protein